MPPWKRLAAAQQERILKCPLADLQAVAEDLQTSYAVALYNRSKALAPVRPAPTPIYDKWFIGHGDILVLSDLQVPCHDADFINQCFDLGSAWGIDTIGFPGDFYNLDYLGPHIPEVVIPTPQDERDAGMEVFHRAGERFARRIWAMGNHDVRALRAIVALGFKPDMAWKMLAPDGVTCSPYHFFEWHSNGKKWYIEHPAAYSKHPGVVGVDLAARELCNVVVAHGHAIGIRRDSSNHFVIIDSGGGFHPAKLGYASLVHNRKPKMNQGAVIIHHGIGYLLDPLNIDWEAMAWLGRRMAK